MKTISATNARLLFVIDNDFGALGLALYFLFRQPIASNATILMPEWLHQKQAEYLSVKSCSYRSYQDIIENIEKNSPDIVFLFSGYLLASVTMRSMFTDIKKFKNLLDNIQKQKCQLVTTDPYLGTFRFFNQFPKQNNKLATISFGLSEFLRSKMLLKAVRQISYLLEDIKHLHAVPSPATQWNKLDNISFYNKHYIRSKDELDQLAGSILEERNDGILQPRWLFVIARFDLNYQIKIHGKKAFTALVVDKLTQAIDNQRHATLIAPKELVDALSVEFLDQEKVSLLAECAFEDFEKHLLSAEAVFYWQIFSTSTFLRLLHGLPVFCFDLGHSAQLSKLFYETCLSHYYLGKAPIMLDINVPLNHTKLTLFTDEFKSVGEYLNSKFSASPSPTEIIETLVKVKN